MEQYPGARNDLGPPSPALDHISIVLSDLEDVINLITNRTNQLCCALGRAYPSPASSVGPGERSITMRLEDLRESARNISDRLAEIV